MNILYDGIIFQNQRAGGINRYFAEIISRLPPSYHPFITGVSDFGKNVPSHPNLQQPCLRNFRPRRVSHWLRERWWKPQLFRKIDLFHPTYFHLSPGYKLADIKSPMVVTVHDFIYDIYPFMGGAPRLLYDQKASISRADFLICVSKATENDLLQRYPDKQGKTAVIYHGSSFEVQPPVKDQSIFEAPSFLYVGSRYGYKNFPFLLRAFAKAGQSNRKMRLRLAGAPLNDDEKWQIHLLGIKDRVEVVVYPDEEELKRLYRSSVALVYPSLHEGFGIPPLEAMACRTLAVTSNTTSLPEVVGDGGIMLDPKSEAAWVECLLNVAAPSAQRDALIERGLNRVRQFSWQKTVDQHLEIYRRLNPNSAS